MNGSPCNQIRRAALVCAGASLLNTLATAQEQNPPLGPVQWPVLNLVGGGVLEAKDWENTPGIVIFWATWCPYCARHNARINQLYHRHRETRLRIIGISTEDSEAQIQAYQRRHALDFPMARSTLAFRGQFSTRRIVPLTCLVRKDGKVARVIPGELAEDDVLALPSLLT